MNNAIYIKRRVASVKYYFYFSLLQWLEDKRLIDIHFIWLGLLLFVLYC